MLHKITSKATLAARLGVHRSSVSRYVRRDDFPAKTSPPWTEADVKIIRDWQSALQEDRNEEHASDRHPFYRQYGYRGNWQHPVVRHDCDPFLPSPDALKQPDAICTPAERDILTGKLKLTPEQVKDLVRQTVRLKAAIVLTCETLPAWLVRQDEEEAIRRMRAHLYEKIGWHRAAVGVSVGRDNVEADE
jgi:hypothetical protein